MSHSLEKKVIGRTTFSAIKLSLDYCTRRYGVNLCTVGREASGTAQAGGSNSITLDASDTFADDALVGYVVYITEGTGEGQEGVITSNVFSTKFSLISANWDTIPDDTSKYILINRPAACYNTRSTCQDVANYDPSPTENEIWITSSNSDFPKDIWDQSNLGVAVPALAKVTATPPKIDIAGGLGQRATLTASSIDFTHHDRGVDLYVESRSYNPEEQGTFWGKFLSRNKYYQGRLLTYYDGYLVNGSFDISNFHERTYVIEQITGPDNKGNVRIIAKDVMKLADSNRSFAPSPSTGTLASDLLTAETGSLVLSSGAGDNYGDSGYVRINSEIIYFASRSGDILNTLTRQTWGTTPADHTTGDSVQLCLAYEDMNVVDIIEDLYLNYADIPSSYIPSTDWYVERDTTLSSNILNTVITEPTGVNELVKELVQQNLIYMWWDDMAKEVKLKAYAPVENATALTDNENILRDSIKIWHDPNLRVSQFWMYYGRRDFTDTGTDNFKFLYISVDTDTEDTSKYGETRLRRIESRWVDESNAGLVLQIGGRVLSLLSETPRMASFRLDAKDEVETGDFVNITTRLMQDASGASISLDMLIIEKKQIEQGTTYEYLAQEFSFTGRYARIGPDSLPDYSADNVLKQDGGDLLTETGDRILLEGAVSLDGATEEQKTVYAWIAPDSGIFANGDEAYKIL